MKLRQLTDTLGASVHTCESRLDAVIDSVYAGDRISDMLAHASETTLVVTNLTGEQLVRVAQLMDIPAICLVQGTTPDPEMKRQAEKLHKVLLTSPFDLFETCGRIYQCLQESGAARP